MLDVGLGFVAIEGIVPLRRGHSVLVSTVIPLGHGGIVDAGVDFSLRRAEGLRNSLLHVFLLGHELGIAAEQNVGTAACHVGGDRDHALASGLGDDFGFALVILGVEDDVLDALLFQELGEALGF